MPPNPRSEGRLRTQGLDTVDPVWRRIRDEAAHAAEREPALATFLFGSVTSQHSLEEAVAARVAARLDHADVPMAIIRQAFHDALEAEPEIGVSMRADIMAVVDRDPATERALDPLLYFKGFHAIQCHRLAHWLWMRGRRDFALYLQSRSSVAFQTDIHPAARIGRGIFLDHATGLVVGATAVVDDDVSMLQDVTLGGTGKESGDRHPKVGRGVMLGAGAKVLGNIQIGHHSRVASGSVVLADVPPCTTVAGVPAKIVGEAGCPEPSRTMDQMVTECG
ncbi:serine O-acetyltransferase [Phreatobacter aquaticus]|uniref:Serine acetyltransferase n=1 Tax=Phreatobacter aquaticus TaxID=2570229 RepID=A0A4D7QQR2_9HYPH|nr:serine O-acetyltransferase [Phreatobacter aquaticus]QCK87946.1 serine O-acetyltransferase [Phreatobacter aquaticus]